MTRDYTEEVYEQIRATASLMRTVDLVVPQTRIASLLLTFADWLGFLKTENFGDKYDLFLAAMTLRHNTTLEQVDQIFEAVDEKDQEYSKKLEKIVESLLSNQNTVQALRDYISGAITYKEAFAIAQAENENAILTQYEFAEEVVTKKEEQIRKEAIRDAIGDALSVVSNTCKLVGCIASGNIVEGIVTAKKLGDSVCALAGDIEALETLKISLAEGEGMSITDENYGEYLKKRFQMADAAEKVNNVDSITSFLDYAATTLEEAADKNGGENSPYYKWAKGARILADIGEVVDPVIDVVDFGLGVSKTIDSLTEHIEYKDVNGKTAKWFYNEDRMEMKDFDVENVVSGEFKGGWDDINTKKGFFGVPKIKGKDTVETVGNIAKIANTAWTVTRGVLPNSNGSKNDKGILESAAETYLGKMFTPIKWVNDAVDIVESVDDMFQTETEPELTGRLKKNPETHEWERVPAAPVAGPSCPVEKSEEDQGFPEPPKSWDTNFKQVKPGVDQNRSNTFAGTGNNMAGAVSGIFSELSENEFGADETPASDTIETFSNSGHFDYDPSAKATGRIITGATEIVSGLADRFRTGEDPAETGTVQGVAGNVIQTVADAAREGFRAPQSEVAGRPVQKFSGEDDGMDGQAGDENAFGGGSAGSR